MTTPQGPHQGDPRIWARPGSSDQPPTRPAPQARPPYPPREGPTQRLPRPSSPMDQPTQHIPRATPTAAPPEPPESEKPRRRFKFDVLSVVLVTVIVLALAAAGLALAEIYARNRADNVVSEATQCVTKDGASVSFGAMPPFLWQHWTGDYQNIRITTAGNNIRSAKDMKADISISDVRLEGGQYGAGTIGALNATITWSNEGIKQSVQEAVPVVGTLVTGVKTNPSDSTIELQGAFGSIVAKPEVVNRDLKLEVVSINALGFPFPPELVQSTLDKLTSQLAENYPLNIRPDSVEMTDSGVVGHFSTRGADIPKDEDPCFANL